MIAPAETAVLTDQALSSYGTAFGIICKGGRRHFVREGFFLRLVFFRRLPSSQRKNTSTSFFNPFSKDGVMKGCSIEAPVISFSACSIFDFRIFASNQGTRLFSLSAEGAARIYVSTNENDTLVRKIRNNQKIHIIPKFFFEPCLLGRSLEKQLGFF